MNIFEQTFLIKKQLQGKKNTIYKIIITSVGEDLFQACKQFVCSGAEGPTRFCSFQVTCAVFETCSHIEKRCTTPMPYQPQPKVRVYHYNTFVEQISKTAAHTVYMWRGVPLPQVTKPCGSFGPKADNTLGWALPSKNAFLWERICFKSASSLSALGLNDPQDFVFFKRHEQFLRLAPTSKKDAPHSCIISLS